MSKEQMKYDKATEKWFKEHPLAESTVCQCKACGLWYKGSLGHKCKKAPTHKKEQAMSKEKQIEEMAKVICGNNRDCKTCGHNCDIRECGCLFYAKRLYEQGYRKQSEGEWETIPDYSRTLPAYRHICSVCKTFYKDIRSRGHKYCHECGAKMKGGEG